MDATPSLAEMTDAAALSEALFHLLADGARHRMVDIAQRLLRRADDQAIALVTREVDALQAAGMSLTHDGRSVTARAVVPLDGHAIERALAVGEDHRPRWTARVVHATASTNSDLLRDVRARDCDSPRILVAEVQREGRGRFGRGWSSAPGASLTASFALAVQRPLAGLDGVPLVCGLAVLEVLADRAVAARLKWPNDVLVDGRKLGGILVEAVACGPSTRLIVGLGLNVAQRARPDALRATALEPTDLHACGSTLVDRNALAAAFALALQRHLAIFESTGFAAFTERWNALDAYRGRRVALSAASGEPLVGIACGVDDRGALQLDVNGERRRIIAGDVSLRPADSPSATVHRP